MTHYPMPPTPSPIPTGRRLNGFGLAAVIIGVLTLLVAWVPFCGSIPAILLAVVGLALGIAGWVWAARERGVGKTLAVVGTLLCVLAIVVGVGTMVVIGMGAGRVVQQVVAEAAKASAAGDARRRQAEAAPATFKDSTVYLVSHDGNLAGTGFVIDAGGTQYAVAAMHPYNGQKPDAFLLIEKDGQFTLGERVHTGQDLQVMRIPQDPPLVGIPYAGPMPLRSGDRLVVLTDAGPQLGILTEAPFSDASEPPQQMRMNQPLKAQGMSGSPVILLSTGTVVGVMLTADNPDAATTVGFEPLKWDPPTGGVEK